MNEAAAQGRAPIVLSHNAPAGEGETHDHHYYMILFYYTTHGGINGMGSIVLSHRNVGEDGRTVGHHARVDSGNGTHYTSLCAAFVTTAFISTQSQSQHSAVSEPQTAPQASPVSAGSGLAGLAGVDRLH